MTVRCHHLSDATHTDSMMCSLKVFMDCTACDGEPVLLHSLSVDEELSILSDATLLKSCINRSDLSICKIHRNAASSRLSSRLRRKLCGLPIVSHEFRFHTTMKVGNRHVTPEVSQRIAAKTGLFIPVGTPICRRCREKLDQRLSLDEDTRAAIPSYQRKKTAMETYAYEENLQEKDVKTESNIEENAVEQQSKRRRVSTDNRDQAYVYSQEMQSEGSGICESQHNDSQLSDKSSGANMSKLEGLNDFLKICKVSPVKKLTSSLSESSERTKKRYMDKAIQCIQSVLETIAPNQDTLLWDAVCKQKAKEQFEQQTESSKELLKEIYSNSVNWQFRRQVLSILVEQMSLEEAQTFIPGLTSWRYYNARRHAGEFGVGQPQQDVQLKRERVNFISLDHFIDFITSTHIVKDLPFGQKTLKLETGEIVVIPNVIRSLSSSSVIDQYSQLCELDGITPLGKSTLYKILTDCSASVRKSVEGLDNYVMEGSRAFQTLDETLECFGETVLKGQLLEAKRYIKTDFKVHMTKETDVLQHCLGYALSTTGYEFQHPCLHQHNKHCQSCIEVDDTLLKILQIEKAVEDVRELQKHLIRSKNQELCRKEVSAHMKPHDVLLTADWAMKFLPRRYREGQLDWFAKRGISWHVAVSLIQLENTVHTLTHIHIFSSQTAQDAKTTTAVLTDVINDLSSSLPNLNDVHIFSDNAGCYKSSLTLSTLRHDVGPKLATYNFSEAQNGKGACDRKAAHAKFLIKKYVNEGRDVTTALDMKKALDTFGGDAYRVRVVDAILDVDTERQKDSTCIKQISSHYNFAFENHGLRMWQAYAIGKGKTLSWDVVKPATNAVQLQVVTDWTDPKIADYTDEPVQHLKPLKPIYTCTMEDCVREFKNKESLENHILQGQCEYMLEKESLSDKSKLLYAKKLSGLTSCCPELGTKKVFVDEGRRNKTEGWALKCKKKKTVFNERQKSYMVQKFKIGKRTGNKVDAYVAAEEMRSGKHSFAKQEFLTAQQIGSYFSRLALQDRKLDSFDIEAANAETVKSDLKSEIINAL